jgi:methylmalonyl-CoA mutase N-terminal domain/subunit
MEEEPYEIPVFRAPEAYAIAKSRDDALKRERDAVLAREALDAFRGALENGDNVMPPLMGAVKAGATSGEIGNLQREVFGTWTPPLPI